MSQNVEVSFDGYVAVIKMNRAPSNAFNLEFVDELNEIVTQLTENTQVRVIVISSRVNRFFATGADIKLIFEMDVKKVLAGLTKLFNTIQYMPKPVIAMIKGHALGGGCELAWACDFRFMEKDSATIGLPEVNLGIISAAGGTQRMTRLLGRGKATELLFEGRQIGAQEALEIGLIHKCFESEDLEAKTLEYAYQLSKQAPIAIQLIKNCLNVGMNDTIEKGLEAEREALFSALETEDAKEGVSAYMERRNPVFKGK